jgi:hypothetical protein
MAEPWVPRSTRNLLYKILANCKEQKWRAPSKWFAVLNTSKWWKRTLSVQTNEGKKLVLFVQYTKQRNIFRHLICPPSCSTQLNIHLDCSGERLERRYDSLPPGLFWWICWISPINSAWTARRLSPAEPRWHRHSPGLSSGECLESRSV